MEILFTDNLSPYELKLCKHYSHHSANIIDIHVTVLTQHSTNITEIHATLLTS